MPTSLCLPTNKPAIASGRTSSAYLHKSPSDS